MFLLEYTCYSYMVIIWACTCENGPRPIPTPHIQIGAAIQVTQTPIKLLKEKACFPYEWLTKENLLAKQLPSIDKFYSV